MTAPRPVWLRRWVFAERSVARAGAFLYRPRPSDSTHVQPDVGLCTVLPVCTSHVPALPHELFEYASAGVPIVASDFPEMGAMVTEHQLGTLCDPTDPRDIAAAVGRILDGDVRRRSAAEVAQSCADFAWERESEDLVRLYAELLGDAELTLPAAGDSR